MPFSIDVFRKRRPFLYHLTATENAALIRTQREIFSAAYLLKQAKQAGILTEPRRGHVVISIDSTNIVIRDQDKLHAGNMKLTDGWTFAEFVEYLNQRVFFWPGDENGPVVSGTRHFQRYQSENPTILRIDTTVLLDSNRDPLFCKYNSGSPRCSQGNPSPRGPRTFVPANEAPFTVGGIVETTFLDRVELPTLGVEHTKLATWNWKRF